MGTAERQREEADERAVLEGLDLSNPSPHQLGSLMRLLHREVLASIRAGTLDRFFARFWGNLSSTDRQAPKDIACGKGCSYCCNSWVSATAPEVLLLASVIRDRGDADAVAWRAAITHGLDFEARGKRVSPCPLLTERGTCSAYDVRPLACRGAASTDSAACRRGYMALSGEGIPVPPFFILQRAGYAIAMRGAFKRAGLPHISYELNEALEVALSTPDAEARWLAGEDIFAGVQRDPNGDPMDAFESMELYRYGFPEVE